MNTLKASTDLDLIESFLSGNQNAFETIVRRHQKKIYSTAMLVVRDKYVAEDILQDTFLKFFKVLLYDSTEFVGFLARKKNEFGARLRLNYTKPPITFMRRARTFFGSRTKWE